MTDVPNGHRGEFPITLVGEDFVLRADYEAVAAIDEQLGSIVDVTNRVVSQASISLREMSVIVCEGMKAHGRKVGYKPAEGYTARKVGEMIYQTGAASCIGPVAQFLLASLNGGTIPAGNAEAAAESLTE
jgi:hypothetical protein